MLTLIRTRQAAPRLFVQRAVGVTEFGGPQALYLAEVPAEPLEMRQERLHVRAATVNPSDTNYRAGPHFPDETAPWIPGMDVAGGSVQGGLVLPAVKDGGAVTAVRGYRGDGQRGIRVFPVFVSEMAEEREALDRLRQ